MTSLCEHLSIFTCELLPLISQRHISALQEYSPTSWKKSWEKSKQRGRKRVRISPTVIVMQAGWIYWRWFDYKLRRKPWDAFDDPFLSQYIVAMAGHMTYTDIFRFFIAEEYTTTQYTTLCWSLCIQWSKSCKYPIFAEHWTTPYETIHPGIRAEVYQTHQLEARK